MSFKGGIYASRLLVTFRGDTTALDYEVLSHTPVKPRPVLQFPRPHALPPIDVEQIKSVYNWFDTNNGVRYTIDFTNKNDHIPKGALYLPPHFTAGETFLIPWSIAKYGKGWEAADIDHFYPMRYPTHKGWMNKWIERLGSELADKDTVSRSSRSTAVGIEYVLFMEAGHNRSRGPLKPKSGAVRIAARAQILRDALGIARNLGQMQELAQREGINGWRETFLYHDPSVLNHDVALVPTNVSYYPLLHAPSSKFMQRCNQLMGRQPLLALELIAHEINLQAKRPTLSITLGEKTGVRDVLGEEYAAQLTWLRVNARSLDDLQPLFEHPAYKLKGTSDEFSPFYRAVRKKTDELMTQAYADMTWNMDHAGLMAIERHVAEGNGPINRQDLLAMIGDAAKIIIESGERHLPHLSTDAVDALHRDRLTPAAEHTLEMLKRLDIIKMIPGDGWQDLYAINEGALHYVPQGSARLLNATEIVRNDLRRFTHVLDKYGLKLPLRV